jgi:hypothetical protein
MMSEAQTYHAESRNNSIEIAADIINSPSVDFPSVITFENVNKLLLGIHLDIFFISYGIFLEQS